MMKPLKTNQKEDLQEGCLKVRNLKDRNSGDQEKWKENKGPKIFPSEKIFKNSDRSGYNRMKQWELKCSGWGQIECVKTGQQMTPKISNREND